jgi:two-component sensor histidine kinase
MLLVRMLGQHQLGGQYLLDQSNGTSWTLTFAPEKRMTP